MAGKTDSGVSTAKVVEVGPRDGFQSVKEFIPTALKLEIIDRLIKAGLPKIQITSFVSPKAIPQMADAKEIAKTCVERYDNTQLFALTPNLRGALDAADAGLREIALVLSLSESHNKANVGKTTAQSVEEAKRIRDELPDLIMGLDIATAFSCPYEGEMELPRLTELIGNLSDIGVNEFTLCDTIGTAYPKQIEAALSALRKAFPDAVFNIHIHDTRNMGILCTYVALQNGAGSMQSSLGGLGGCPFAPGASGNTATEDLIYMLEANGYSTGVDINALQSSARYLRKHVEGNYSGHHVNMQCL